MFCSRCGKRADGKFCWNCGAALVIPETLPDGDSNASDIVTAEEVVDLDFETRYDVLVKVPEVRAAIERHAKLAKKTLSGEEFLGLCDKIVSVGFPMEKMVTLVQPLYERFGVATGQERAEMIEAPVGRVLVRLLCSLARHGQTIRGVQQAADGCFIEAVLPSDLFALAGDLLVAVHVRGQQAEVRAATRIPGQYFDWGKSRRRLDELFASLRQDVNAVQPLTGEHAAFFARRSA